METLLAILSDERTYVALLGLLSVIAAAMPSVGGGRFVVVKRILEGARGVFVKKPVPVVLFALALSSGPAHAQDAEPPAVGCGSGTCSVYFVSASWPPALGINALEFVKGSFGVGKTGIHGEGDLNYIGGLCLIPKVDTIVPICPAAE